MKSFLRLLFAGALMAVTFVACEKDDPSEEGKVFYYFGLEDKKIFLYQVKDEIYVKYTSGEEERITLGDASLDFYKAKPEVVSANYLLQDEGRRGFVAITDGFTVQLKATTAYVQLQVLAQRHHCRIGEEDEFVENQYMLCVPKSSDRDALQMANLFYETGLFEYAHPDFRLWGTFD